MKTVLIENSKSKISIVSNSAHLAKSAFRLVEMLTIVRYTDVNFDGTTDSIFQEFDKSGKVFMQYLHDYGAFEDLPYKLYLSELKKHYPHIFDDKKYMNGDLVYNFTKGS